MSGDLGAQLRQLLQGLSAEQKAALDGVLAAKLNAPFRPLPGPQTEAYVSPADMVLYGGQAGGGKSGLVVGAASNHRRALILRRQSVELDGLIDFAKEIYSDHAKFNGTDLEFTFADKDCQIKFGGCNLPDDWAKYRGTGRDYLAFDEAGEFLESQVASLCAWNRSSKGGRTRIVLASNPPSGADGIWLLKWFAPWLDPLFPDPAKPGELRWCIMIAGETRWVDGSELVVIDGDEYLPMSRTFIRAALSDNPYNDKPEYRARLTGLPEPLRSQLLKGDFAIGKKDAENQVIPSDWVSTAMARWKPERPNVKMLSLGVDVAQGGIDQTCLAPLYGSYFDTLVIRPGIDTKDGPSVAGLVIENMRHGCQINMDLTGGWGGSARDHLLAAGIKVNPVVFSGSANGELAANGRMGFANMRAQLYWKFREALDPNSDENIALPPDARLAAELAAPTWKLRGDRILIESKDEIKKRLGISPDRADAVVLAWHDRSRAIFMRDHGHKINGEWATAAPIADPFAEYGDE